MNTKCLGGLVVGHALTWELAQANFAVRLCCAESYRCRLFQITDMDNKKSRL